MPHPNANEYDDDRILVAAILGGDMEAFKQLVRQYENLVISIVFKMITRLEDREDLSQDVFLKVYEKLASFRFQSKLSTWIGSIAFNTCANFLKKQKIYLLDDVQPAGYSDSDRNEKIITDSANNPREVLEGKEREKVFQNSVQKLSIIQQTVLQLFHYNELSLDEISVITTFPVSTVKSHLFRARKKLKEEMDKY